MAAGILVFGYLGDNIGRKNALRTSWKVFTIGGLIYPFVHKLSIFMIGYILACFGSMAGMVLQIALINEETSKFNF